MHRTRRPSPARSESTMTPRRKTQSTRSVGSPSSSNSPDRLTSIVDQFKAVNWESIAPSPLNKTVLSDNTEIEQPRRQSWWKKVNHSTNISEVLEVGKAIEPSNIMDDLEVEVLSQEKKTYLMDLPESSGSESIGSIVIPQRKLFTQKENVPHDIFKQILDTRKSMTKQNKTYDEDKTVYVGTKTLFGRGIKRSRPVFPAALLNVSPDKTLDTKTKELPTEIKTQPRNLFGHRQGTKQKNMFADFIVSESEDEISEIQPKLFAFQRNTNPVRHSTASRRSRSNREASPASSLTTDIEMDDWKMLPSSTMVEHQFEAIAASTPGKKARLSKLSEAKESDAGTNSNNTVNKTKLSNKSTSKNKSKLTPEITTKESELDKAEKKDEVETTRKQEDSPKSKSKGNSSNIKNISEKTVTEYEDAINANGTKNKINNKTQVLNKTGNGNLPVVDEKSRDVTNMQSDANSRVINNQTYKINSDSDVKLQRKSQSSGNETQEEKKEAINSQLVKEAQIENKELQVDTEIEVETEEEVQVEAEDKEQVEAEREVQVEADEEIQVEDDDKVQVEAEKEVQVEADEEIQVEDDDEMQVEAEEEDQVETEDQLQFEDEKEVQVEANEEIQVEAEEEIEVEAEEEDEVEAEDRLQFEEEDEVQVESNEEVQVETDEEIEVEADEEIEVEADEEIEVEAEEEIEVEAEEEEQVEAGDEVQAEAKEDVQVQIEENEELDDEEQEKVQFEDNEREVQVEDDESDVENDEENQNQNVMGVESEEEQQNESEVENEKEDENEENFDEDNIEQDNEIEESEENIQAEVQKETEEIDGSPETSEAEAETPNVTHDTTGRHGQKDVQSPEDILHNMPNQAVSFIAKGHNTSIRKTLLNNFTVRQSEAPLRESTGLDDGTKDSSAEGSGWDSHRTTRKTLRQTFGKDFTPRKSLRVLVMEKSAKRQTAIHEANAKLNQANSTEIPGHNAPDIDLEFDNDVEIIEESDNEINKRTRQTTLEMHLQKVRKDIMEKRLKIQAEVSNRVAKRLAKNQPSQSSFPKPRAIQRYSQHKTDGAKAPKAKRTKANIIPLEHLPEDFIHDLKYKPPKRYKPHSASWITKRLYKFLETKLVAKYDYKARVRAEKLVETIFTFTMQIRKQRVAPPHAIAELKYEMARLEVVKTHYEFYDFIRDYMPFEIKIKVVPDVLNNIPLPRDVFSNIME